MEAIPTPRLYGSAIAIVSGVYSIGSSLGASMGAPMMGMGAGGAVMLVIGVVVLVHGLVLLTPIAANLGGVSGPLMIVWSVVMLANQYFGMMGWDGGMVAIAVLMLVSGLIMTIRRSGPVA